MNRIQELLDKYQTLGECVILNINWLHYGTTIELVFDYVWDDDGKIRTDLEQEDRITLRFRLVQEFHLKNALNSSMVLEPQEMNWGINEIARIKLVENENMLRPYASLPKEFHHIAILWERGDQRRIDIVFSEFDIIRHGIKNM